MLHITFVCTGNICRSPMGEVILREHIHRAGLEHMVRVSSCGTGGWHIGDPADHRSVTALRQAGYDGSAHRAAQLSSDHLSADLIVALDRGHREELYAAGAHPDSVRLLLSFVPNIPTLDTIPADQLSEDILAGDVPDPYYGDESDFALARDLIESAMPGMMSWVHTHQGDQ